MNPLASFISLLATKPTAVRLVWISAIHCAVQDVKLSIKQVAALAKVSESSVGRALDWGIPVLRNLNLLKNYQMKMGSFSLELNLDADAVNTDAASAPAVIPVEKSEPKPKKSKNQCPPEYLPLVEEILNHLKHCAAKNFDPNGKINYQPIIARLKEGKTLSQFKHVIEVKTKKWINTEREDYLRPETLFGNKMEVYIQENIITNTNGNSTLSTIQRSIRTAAEAADAIVIPSKDG